MSFVVERVPNKPIIVSRTLEDYDMDAEQLAIQEAVRKHLDSALEKLFYIIDLTYTQFDFNSLLTGTNVGARSLDTSTWRHENVRELIFVSPNPVIRRISIGMNSEAFGYLQSTVFDTMDDAMAYIETKL